MLQSNEVWLDFFCGLGIFFFLFNVYQENEQVHSLNHRIRETGNGMGHKRSSITFMYNSSIVPGVALNDM